MSVDFRPVASPDLSEEERAINRVAEAVHRANDAIPRAVSIGISVELARVSRHHDGAGNWGDQMIPMVRERSTPAGA